MPGLRVCVRLIPETNRCGGNADMTHTIPWQPGGAAPETRHKPTRSVFKALLRLTGVFSLASALSGCGLFTPPAVAPAQTEPTNLDLRLQASNGLNPDARGRAAPILVRVYELRSAQGFQDADFFSLYNADRSTLGTDVLAVDQLILRPGQSHRIERKSHPETRAIGVLAGYRDLPNATWRAVQPMPEAPEAKWYRGILPNQRLQLQIDLQPLAVRVTDLRQGQAPLSPNDPRVGTQTPANTVPLTIPQVEELAVPTTVPAATPSATPTTPDPTPLLTPLSGDMPLDMPRASAATPATPEARAAHTPNPTEELPPAETP